MSAKRISKCRKSRRHSAFTLMEILLVLAILVVLGSLSVFAFRDTLFSSKVKTAKIQIDELKIPLNNYMLEYSQFPPKLEDLWNPTDSDTSENRQKRFLEKEIPLDPWGKPYQYDVPGTKSAAGYDLFSAGPDGQEGTGDDIGNWK